MFACTSLELESRAGTWVPGPFLPGPFLPGPFLPGPFLPAARGQGTTDVRRRIRVCFHKDQAHVLLHETWRTFMSVFILSSKLVGMAAGKGGSVRASPLASLHEMMPYDNGRLLLTPTDAGWSRSLILTKP